MDDEVYDEGLLRPADDETFVTALALKYIFQMETIPNSTNGCQRRQLGVSLKVGLQLGEKITSNVTYAGNHILKETSGHEDMLLPEFVILAKSVVLNCVSHIEEGPIPL